MLEPAWWGGGVGSLAWAPGTFCPQSLCPTFSPRGVAILTSYILDQAPCWHKTSGSRLRAVLLKAEFPPSAVCVEGRLREALPPLTVQAVGAV